VQMTVAVSPTQLTVDVRVPSVWPEAVFLRNYLIDWYGLLGDPALNWQTNKSAVSTTRLALICLRGDSVLLFQGYGPRHPGTSAPWSRACQTRRASSRVRRTPVKQHCRFLCWSGASTSRHEPPVPSARRCER
jgi:hypothetical protein